MRKLMTVFLVLISLMGATVFAQTATDYSSQLGNMYPQSITIDHSDNLWIGGDAGSDTVAAMISSDLNTWAYYDTLDLMVAELGDDEVYDIGVADNGTACFLTHYGVSYMDSEGHVEAVSGSEGTYTKGFVVDGNMLYWTYDGTPLAVLYEYDLESEQQVGEIYDTDVGMNSGPSHLTVYEGARDYLDQLWLCTHWGVIYEDTNGDWHTLLDGLYPDNLVSDKDGNIWISYGSYPYNDTLMQVDANGEVLAKYSSEDVPEMGWLNGLTDIATDANGHVWMVTDSVGIIDFAGPGDYTLYNEIDMGGDMLDLRDNVVDLEVRGDEVWLALYDGRMAMLEGYITVTDIGEQDNNQSVPAAFALHQNYPNPFNPETTIQYELSKAAEINVSIYDVTGKRIKTLEKGWRPAGVHNVSWDGRDRLNRKVASGLYFYQLQMDDKQISKKMILMK